MNTLHNVVRAEDVGQGDGLQCPVCLDVMRDNVSQLRPAWSDHYDEVVCTTCQEDVLCQSCNGEPIKLDDAMDTPECGCNTWICRECGNDIDIPNGVMV